MRQLEQLPFTVRFLLFTARIRFGGEAPNEHVLSTRHH
jgi:hypothetical protein